MALQENFTTVAIDVYRRIPNTGRRISHEHSGPGQWVAQWPCPGCGHSIFEVFPKGEPASEQVEEIKADPLCVYCRHRRQAGVALPLDPKP